ncbi:9652_t:CDS:2, partial [Paraglomus occultum]
AHFMNTWKTAIAYKVMDIPQAGGFIKQPECKPLAIVDQPALFIRQSYVDLYNLVVDNARQNAMLELFLKQGRGLSITSMASQRSMKLQWTHYFSNQLGSDGIWYLADGVTDPLQGSAKTVVSLSPKGVRSKQFQEITYARTLWKVGGVPLYVLEVPAAQISLQGVNETWEKEAEEAAMKHIKL